MRQRQQSSKSRQQRTYNTSLKTTGLVGRSNPLMRQGTPRERYIEKKIINFQRNLEREKKQNTDVAIQQLQKFKSHGGLNGRLVSKNPSQYNVTYAKGYGFISAPYMSGVYEEFDPKTLTVKVIESTLRPVPYPSGRPGNMLKGTERVVAKYKLGQTVNLNNLKVLKKGVKGTPQRQIYNYRSNSWEKYVPGRTYGDINNERKYAGEFNRDRTNPGFKYRTVTIGAIPDMYVFKSPEIVQNELKGLSSKEMYYDTDRINKEFYKKANEWGVKPNLSSQGAARAERERIAKAMSLGLTLNEYNKIKPADIRKLQQQKIKSETSKLKRQLLKVSSPQRYNLNMTLQEMRVAANKNLVRGKKMTSGTFAKEWGIKPKQASSYLMAYEYIFR